MYNRLTLCQWPNFSWYPIKKNTGPCQLGRMGSNWLIICCLAVHLFLSEICINDFLLFGPSLDLLERIFLCNLGTSYDPCLFSLQISSSMMQYATMILTSGDIFGFAWKDLSVQFGKVLWSIPFSYSKSVPWY